MANKRGLFDTSDFETNIDKLDIRDKIFELEPDETPFVSILSKLTKLKAINVRYSWFEDTMLGNSTTFTVDPTITSTQTLFTVADTGIFQEGDVAGCFSSDVSEAEEVVLIQTIISTTQMQVVRSWGSTPAAAHAVGDHLYKLGSAMQEGYDAPESLVTEKEEIYNYVQIFSKTVMITNQAENVDTYGGNRRNFERHKVAMELKRDLESQLLWGERWQDLTGSAHPRYQTGGVYWLLAQGTCATELDMSAASLTESAFEGWLKDVFTYGSKEKFFFTGPLILSQISQFATGKQRLEPGTTTEYGVKVTKYHSAMGDVNLVHDKHFLGAHAGKGLMLDMKELVYRYLQNSDFKLALNIQPNNAHYKMDEYTGTVGLELHHAGMHSMVRDVA